VSCHLNLSIDKSLNKTNVITTPYPIFAINFVSFVLTPAQPRNSGMTSGCCLSKILSTHSFSIHFANASLDFKAAEIDDFILDWSLLLK
tara:strand:- start:15095 stop:15361 length:267 start_codon:yes stop_codon:yes gene_type:complete